MVEKNKKPITLNISRKVHNVAKKYLEDLKLNLPENKKTFKLDFGNYVESLIVKDLKIQIEDKK